MSSVLQAPLNAERVEAQPMAVGDSAQAAAADELAPNPRQAELDALWQALEDAPWRFDLFAVLRRLQAAHPQQPAFGTAKRPLHEPLRLGQEPSSSFAPRTLAFARRRGARPPKLSVLSFGLFGPNGPLPLAHTEYAHERAIHAGDRALTEFADLFHHRLLLLFYRAWAQAQSTASLDLGDAGDFNRYCASLIGYGLSGQTEADSVPLHARLHHAGHFARQSRNAEGLACALSNYFEVPAAIEQHRGHWLPLPSSERSRLGHAQGSQLGVDAVAGAAVWDRQHRFRIVLGPMPLTRYRGLLPEAEGARQLRDWVRSYVGIEFDWDLQLVLRAADVEGASLGGGSQLGWTSWLSPRGARDRADLTYRPEHHPCLAARGEAASAPNHC